MRNTRGIPTDYTAQLIEDSDDETGFPGVPKIAKKCRFSCTLCQKRFVRAVHLENHIRHHVKEKPFPCSTCGQGFAQLAICRRHERSHKGISKPVNHAVAKKGKRQSQKIRAMKTLELVKKRKHAEAKSHSDNSKSNGHHDPSSSTGKKQHSQETCTKNQKEERITSRLKFNKPPATKLVNFYREGKKFVKCPICNKIIRSINIKIHMRVHTGDRPYQCSSCDKRFKQKNNLNNHERIHSGTKPYACSKCKKKFRTLAAVLQHERVHSGIKPYACSRCAVRYKQSGSLKYHITHREPDGKVLKCKGQGHRRKPSIDPRKCFVVLTRCSDTKGNNKIEESPGNDTLSEVGEASPPSHRIPSKEDDLSNAEAGYEVIPIYGCSVGVEDFKRPETAPLSTVPSDADARDVSELDDDLEDLEQANANDDNPRSIDKSSFGTSTSISAYTYKCTFCQEIFEDLTLLREHYMNVHDVQQGHFTTEVIILKHRELRLETKNTSYSQVISEQPVNSEISQVESNEIRKVQNYGQTMPEPVVQNHTRVLADTSGYVGSTHTASICATTNKRNISCSPISRRKSRKGGRCRPTLKNARHKPSRRGQHNLRLPKGRIQNQGPFQCNQCDKRFLRRDSLKRHLALHTGIRPFHCTFCSARFAQHTGLKQHIRIHTGERPYQCTICWRRFIQQSHVQNHCLKVHKNRGFYKLVQPKTTHSENKTKSRAPKRAAKVFLRKYRIAECYVRLQRCDQLKGYDATVISTRRSRHSRKSHKIKTPNREIGQFKCGYCRQHFLQLKLLKQHSAKLHGVRPPHSENLRPVNRQQISKSRCTICKQKFSNPQALQRHSFLHSGSRQFPCSSCTKRFGNLYSLQVHQLIHSGEKPYRCMYCMKTFRQPSHAQKHGVNVHGKRNSYVKEPTMERLTSAVFDGLLSQGRLCRVKLNRCDDMFLRERSVTPESYVVVDDDVSSSCSTVCESDLEEENMEPLKPADEHNNDNNEESDFCQREDSNSSKAEVDGTSDVRVNLEYSGISEKSQVTVPNIPSNEHVSATGNHKHDQIKQVLVSNPTTFVALQSDEIDISGADACDKKSELEASDNPEKQVFSSDSKSSQETLISTGPLTSDSQNLPFPKTFSAWSSRPSSEKGKLYRYGCRFCEESYPNVHWLRLHYIYEHVKH